MRNKLYHFAFLLLLVSVLGVGCSKLEIPEVDDKDKTDKGDTPSQPTQPDDSGRYTVAALQSAEEGEVVTLKGYIVGYVPTTSIQKMVFGATDAVLTNIVLADSPTETSPNNCAAIQLKNDSDARDNLNLCDNPDCLGKCVLVNGNVATYMGSLGLKYVDSYEWIDADDDDDNDNEQPTHPTNPSQSVDFPTVSDEAPIVFEGD